MNGPASSSVGGWSIGGLRRGLMWLARVVVVVAMVVVVGCSDGSGCDDGSG